MAQCEYWWAVWLSVSTGGQCGSVRVPVVSLVQCDYWWSVWLSVHTTWQHGSA